jgi:hypothetical protein
MKNAKGQEVRWVLEEDMLAWLKETQTPEKYAEIEARHKELREQREQIRERFEALRPKNTQTTVRVRLESGQIVVDNAKKLIWPTEEEFCAQAKEGLSPEVLAWKKEAYRRMREQYEKGNKPISITTDSEGCVVGFAGPLHAELHAAMPPLEMITDPWTGQPKVFTAEERANYDLSKRGWPPERRERVACFKCKICNRLFREHSVQEFADHMAQIVAPTVRLYAKGKRAKKETIARSTCEICSRIFGDHSQQEYDACINQSMKRHKPKREDLRYVKCEICGSRFGDHSPEKFEACIDQMIENSV